MIKAQVICHEINTSDCNQFTFYVKFLYVLHFFLLEEITRQSNKKKQVQESQSDIKMFLHPIFTRL